MKTKEAFEQYYSEVLFPEIQKLELQRLNILKKFTFKKYRRILLFMLPAIIALAIMNGAMPSFPEIVLALTVLFTVLFTAFYPLYLFIRRNLASEPLKTAYKREIVSKILSFVDEDLSYEPEQGITQFEMRMGMIQTNKIKPVSFKSEDLVKGKLKEYPIRFSDVNIAYRHEGSSIKEKPKYFNGVYLIMKSDYIYPYQTYIYQVHFIISLLKRINDASIKVNNAAWSTAINLSDRLLLKELSRSFVGKIDTTTYFTNNTAFDGIFGVLTDNSEETKKIMTDHFIDGLLKLVQKSSVHVNLSFFNNEVHIVFTGEDMFETDVHVSLLKEDHRISSVRYFEILTIIYQLLELISTNSENYNN